MFAAISTADIFYIKNYKINYNKVEKYQVFWYHRYKSTRATAAYNLWEE